MGKCQWRRLQEPKRPGRESGEKQAVPRERSEVGRVCRTVEWYIVPNFQIDRHPPDHDPTLGSDHQRGAAIVAKSNAMNAMAAARVDLPDNGPCPAIVNIQFRASDGEPRPVSGKGGVRRSQVFRRRAGPRGDAELREHLALLSVPEEATVTHGDRDEAVALRRDDDVRRPFLTKVR